MSTIALVNSGAMESSSSSREIASPKKSIHSPLSCSTSRSRYGTNVSCCALASRLEGVRSDTGKKDSARLYLKSSGMVKANMQLLKHKRLASLSISSFCGAGPRRTLIAFVTRFQHGRKYSKRGELWGYAVAASIIASSSLSIESLRGAPSSASSRLRLGKNVSCWPMRFWRS